MQADRNTGELPPSLLPTMERAPGNTPYVALLLTSGLMELGLEVGLELGASSGIPESELVSFTTILALAWLREGIPVRGFLGRGGNSENSGDVCS